MRGEKKMKKIVKNTGIQGGSYVFEGTRISVFQIKGLLKRGISNEEILEDYPDLEAEDIENAKEFNNK